MAVNIKNPILKMLRTVDDILEKEMLNKSDTSQIQLILKDLKELYYIDYNIVKLSGVVHFNNLKDDDRKDFEQKLRAQLAKRKEMFSNFKIKEIELSS